MIELISLHIPKTGGQSFYKILEDVYGDKLSISYRRRDYKAVMEEYRRFEDSIPAQLQVLHGHLYYKEVKRLHKHTDAKVICWMRDPVERVVSNYHFFKSRLDRPDLNPEVARLNAHRKDETLLEYAARRHTRNRMSKFLRGISLDDLYFIGFLEDYDADLKRLGRLLGWGKFEVPHVNRAESPKPELDETTLKKLRRWNSRDVKLYERARGLKS
jgi:hypothetical protein